MTYKDMQAEPFNLMVGGKFGEIVDVIELGYKNTDTDKQKEIVFAIFATTMKQMSKDKAFSLVPLETSGDKAVFHVKDFEKEYQYNVLQKGDTYSHIIMRNPVKNKVTENKGVKRSLSSMKPIIFIDSVNPTFKQKEDVYQAARNLSKFSYVPNMSEVEIMSKHIDSDDKETTAEMIKDIQEGGKNKADFNSRQYVLAEFYLNVYKNWVEFYFETSIELGLLEKLEMRVSNMRSVPYFLEHNDDIVEPYLQAAIQDGRLAFSKNKKRVTDIIENNADYTKKYAVAQAMQINTIAKPLHVNGEIREEVIEVIEAYSERKLFGGQTNAIDAMIKALDRKRNVTIVGEMGTGKTTMMYLTALTHSKIKVYRGGKRFPMKLLVFTPDHLKYTGWENDIKQITGNNIEIIHISSVSDVVRAEREGKFDDEKDYVFILGQTDAKRKFSYAPCPTYNPRTEELSCPCCGEVIKKKTRVYDEMLEEYVTVNLPVNHLFFATKTPSKTNKFCKKCGESLWAIERKEMDSSLFYSKVYGGFVVKDEKLLERNIRLLQSEYNNTESKKKKAIKSKLEQAKKALAEFNGEEKVVRRVSEEAAVAHYIFKRMKYKFSHLIADEVHEFQGNSLRYEACKWLVKSIRYVITGTGTAMSGYANSRFRTDFLLNPSTMIANGYRHNDSEKFQEDFGVVEKRYRTKKLEDGTIKKMALRPKNKPSINPAVFPKFMQDCCVFVSMDDMGADMPELKYIPMPVELDETLKKEYEQFITEVKKATVGRKNDFLSIFQTSNLFLDAPQKEHIIWDKKNETPLVKSPVVTGAADKKLEKLLEVAHDRVKVQGKKMLIYVHFKAGGIKDYLREHLTAQGFNVAVLNSNNEHSLTFDDNVIKVKKEERETWIRGQAALGADIVICNPTLVQTGCNLIEFPIIVNYQLSYSTYVIRQADRRAWRLNQKEVCEVINIFYAETIQNTVASLMATKIVSSRSIEGNMDSDGLEALCDSRTAEEEMAAEFYAGVKSALEAAEAV